MNKSFMARPIERKSRASWMAWVGVCLLFCPAFAQPQPTPQLTPTKPTTPQFAVPTATPKATKTTALSAAQYRALLAAALQKMTVMEKHRPRPLGPIADGLDAKFSVRRADGQTQTVSGNQWSSLKSQLSKPLDVRREEVSQARRIAQNQIRALDEWIKTPNYTSADAQKIVADLEKSGQIRVGPLWWQKAIADTLKAIGDAWAAFAKWLNGLLPKSRATPAIAAPSDAWLWGLFYIVVAALLGMVLWFLLRAFGGSWSGWGRSKMRRATILEGEDAQLLLLPPDELRLRADEFAAKGQFREALRHRYLALLLQLDARGVWRYDARRTNWEHIAALRRSETKSALVPALSDLTRRFDRVRYGGAPCDGPQWTAFSSDAQNLEAQTLSASMAPKMEVAR